MIYYEETRLNANRHPNPYPNRGGRKWNSGNYFLDLPDNILAESYYEIELKCCLYFEHLKGEMNFHIEDILNSFFIFCCTLIIFKVEDFILWLGHTMEIRLIN